MEGFMPGFYRDNVDPFSSDEHTVLADWLGVGQALTHDLQLLGLRPALKVGDDGLREAAYRGGCRACQNLSKRAIRHERDYQHPSLPSAVGG